MASRTSIPIVSKIPLTTIFTPAPECTNSFYTYHPLPTTLSGASYFLRAQAPHNEMLFDEKYSACYPPKHGEVVRRFHQTPQGNIVYSPGVCPSGYSSWQAPQHSYANKRVARDWVCCPIGFQWHEYQACKSSPLTSTVVALNASTNKTVTPPYVLLDWPLSIQWASSDFEAFTPASAPLPRVFKQATTGDDGGGGLSTGAKAGIGAGIAIVVLALLALLAGLLFMRRKRRRREREQQRYEEVQQQSPDYTSPHMRGYSDTTKLGPEGVAVEVDATSPAGTSELSGGPDQRSLSELDSARSTLLMSPSSELCGSSPRPLYQHAAPRELEASQIHELEGDLGRFGIQRKPVRGLGLSSLDGVSHDRGQGDAPR